MTSTSISVEAVGNWLLQHIDELLEKYPELKKKLKKKLLENLEEKIATKDEILAVLNELKKLREDFNRQQEQINDLMIELKKLREDFNRQQEQISGIMTEIKRLREDFNRQQEQINGLIVEIKKLREDFNRLSERLDLKLSALGARWGLYSENAFRNAMRYVVERYFGGRVQRWTHYDSEGLVYGHSSEIDVDVLIKDTEHILIEIKAHADRSDIVELYRKGILYEKTIGVKPRLIIVAPFVRDRAYKTAAKLGVEIIEGIPEA